MHMSEERAPDKRTISTYLTHVSHASLPMGPMPAMLYVVLCRVNIKYCLPLSFSIEQTSSDCLCLPPFSKLLLIASVFPHSANFF